VIGREWSGGGGGSSQIYALFWLIAVSPSLRNPDISYNNTDKVGARKNIYKTRRSGKN
jgi:hypothetical protein